MRRTELLVLMLLQRMMTVSPTCNQAQSQNCQVRAKVHPGKVERRSFFCK